MEKTSATQTNLSAYNNEWYKPGSLVKRLLWYMVSRLLVNTYVPYPSAFKAAILRVFGAQIGQGVAIKPKVHVKYPWFLRVADHVWIGENVWIDNLILVTIESNVCLSQGAMLLTGNHNYTKSAFDLIVRPITLEKGCWIGAKATVCPGVQVGQHAVLTVGSVATTNLEAFGIYQGNPAKYVKTRTIIS